MKLPVVISQSLSLNTCQAGKSDIKTGSDPDNPHVSAIFSLKPHHNKKNIIAGQQSGTLAQILLNKYQMHCIPDIPDINPNEVFQ